MSKPTNTLLTEKERAILEEFMQRADAILPISKWDKSDREYALASGYDPNAPRPKSELNFTEKQRNRILNSGVSGLIDLYENYGRDPWEDLYLDAMSDWDGVRRSGRKLEKLYKKYSKEASFIKAARHVLCTRMVKKAYSEEGALALEHLAETGQMPESMVQRLLARYHDLETGNTWSKVRRRALQGLGIGGGLGVAGGAFRGLVDQNGILGTTGSAIGGGLRNAGIGTLIGGGIGLTEAFLGADKDRKEKEQLHRILSKLQNAPAEEAPTGPPPEAVMADMQAQRVPSSGPVPSITYNIHNFGPQAFSPK